MSTHWKKIPLAEAQAHPLYGVKNWLAVFALGVLLGGLRELGSLNSEAHKAGLTINELLAIDHPAIYFAKLSLWLNAGFVFTIYWALLTKHPNFRLIASGLLLASWPIGAILGLINYFSGLGAALALSLFPWLISCGVWVTYLNRSKRVRVTFENSLFMGSPTNINTSNNMEADRQVNLQNVAPTPASSPHNGPSIRNVINDQASNEFQITTSEQFWAAALQELEGPSRRPGLWARSFAEANGDEAMAKAKYLAFRSSEIDRESQASAIRRKQSEEGQRRIRELDQLSEDERAYALLPKGMCPNCGATIALTSQTCPKCKAMFGPGSTWTVTPQSAQVEFTRQSEEPKRAEELRLLDARAFLEGMGYKVTPTREAPNGSIASAEDIIELAEAVRKQAALRNPPARGEA